jgi:hypothetical protein
MKNKSMEAKINNTSVKDVINVIQKIERTLK